MKPYVSDIADILQKKILSGRTAYIYTESLAEILRLRKRVQELELQLIKKPKNK